MLTAKVSTIYRPFSRDSAIMLTVALISMLAPLNSTMIAVTLPQIMAEFGANLGTVGWLVTAYLLAMAALQPIAGKIGDRWGQRRLILGGLVWFALASLGATLAPSLAILLGMRVQQALAAALTLPNAVALIRETAPAAARGKWFGNIGAATSLAAAVGPLVGGVLVNWAGWRMVFLVNLLLVVPALLLGWRTLPSQHYYNASRRFDWTGALLLATCLSGLAGLLTRLRTAGLESSALLLGSLLMSGLLLLLVWWERRHPDPVLPPHFFQRRTFAAANVAIAFSNLAMYVTLLSLPLLLNALGWTSDQTGLVLAAFSVGAALLAPAGGRLADQWGRRWPTVGGLALLALGLLPLALPMNADRMSTHLPLLVAGLAIAGIGLGIAAAGLQTAAVEAVAAKQVGVAAGVFSTSRYLGSITGSVLLAALVAGNAHDFAAFQRLFLLVMMAAWVAVGASLLLHDQPREQVG